MACIMSYNTTAALPCRGCGGDFKKEDEVLLFENRRWHQRCFVCGGCKKAFTAITEADNVRDMPYCKGQCHWKASRNMCGNCGEQIEGEFIDVKLLHKKYHADCFRCVKCNRVIDAGFRKRDNGPECLDCSKGLS
eukprot:TRINITY_DN26760_c0_g1_i1.p1 TRINITY_DN26760_c0_g1~~TRINITY_DN26760_c0_g1_i1.p1  ORF type:complete len:135 (+),score=3.59 TRINITY_DN26760_c0_g1_i1:143-547(+)